MGSAESTVSWVHTRSARHLRGVPVSDAVLRIASDLAAAPSTGVTEAIIEACQELAAVTDCQVVALRALGADDVAHYVAGWSDTDMLEGPQPPLVLRNDCIPSELVIANSLQEMPILPLGLDIKRWASGKTRTPSTLFAPILSGDVAVGFLCLVRSNGHQNWDEESTPVLSSIMLAASAIGHFHARSRAEQSLRRQVEVAELLRVTTQDLFALVSGEEDRAIQRVFQQFGEMLGAASVTLWVAQSDPGVAKHQFRWTAPGSSAPNIKTPTVAEAGAEWARFRNLDGPIVIGSNRMQDLNRHLVNPATATGLSWVVTPGRLRSVQCNTLVMARQSSQPWADFEISAIAALADLIPMVQDRLAIESQVVATFHAAPLGITVRSAEGLLLDCNQAFLDFLGIDSEVDLLGKSGTELLASDELTEGMFETLAKPDPSLSRGVELPYRHASGSVVWGRLSIARIAPEGPEPTTPTWLTHIEDVTAQRPQQILTQYRAHNDEVTGLPNRHRLIDAVEDLVTRSATVDLTRPSPQQAVFDSEPQGEAPTCHSIGAVALLDLNKFKRVNDTLGHSAGDALLAGIGSRLRAAVRSGDTVGRYGGDEFLVVMQGAMTTATASARLAALESCFVEPFSIDGEDIYASASIGLTLVYPTDSVKTVVKRADAAMYRLKETDAAQALPHR